MFKRQNYYEKNALAYNIEHFTYHNNSIYSIYYSFMIFDSDKKKLSWNLLRIGQFFYLHMFNFISSETGKKTFHNGLKWKLMHRRLCMVYLNGNCRQCDPLSLMLSAKTMCIIKVHVIRNRKKVTCIKLRKIHEYSPIIRWQV